MLFFLMIRLPPRSTLTDTLFPYTTLFRSHQIVEHLDDAAASEAEIDAALKIVACRIAQDGRELALAARLTLLDPAHRLARFEHRIIGLLEMHTERPIGLTTAGGAALLVPHRIAPTPHTWNTVVSGKRE